MKIKIGNFNFINKLENKMHNFEDLRYADNYFWLDGKENKLFVLDMSNFEISDKERIPEFEKILKERFEIVPLYRRAKEEINNYINKKVENLINMQNYSKYHLYKDMRLSEILDLKNNTNFAFSFDDYYYVNFDTNKIEIGKFRYNPYNEKIENIEECENRLEAILKKKIILKEIEKGIAPKFITEIMKIDDFLKDKKSCYLIFNGIDEKYPLKKAVTSDVVQLWEGQITLESYSDKFELKDLKGLLYGKNFQEVNPINLMNIDKQIAVSLEDRLEQRIDLLKKKEEKNYGIYSKKNEREYYDIPIDLDTVIKNMSYYQEKELPGWLTKKVEEMCYKYNLLNYLSEVNDLEEIKNICIELKDKELQSIVYNMMNEEEYYTENEDSQEEMEV